jgi:hypothetical protein
VESELNFAAVLKKIPEYQWLTMLNYEYARCYKPIIEMMDRLRQAEQNPKSNEVEPLPFARFLARIFPEFPSMPWAQIPETKRAERLGWFDVTPETKFYLPDPAWRAWKWFDDEAPALPEELTEAAAESYGFFRIDFSQRDVVIAGQFSAWLEQRRSEVFERYKEFKLNRANQPPAGRGHKKRKCRDYLKALGGLRALQYYKNAEEAETMTNNLYTDNHSWKRAKIQASEMFARLAEAWKYLAVPFDPFQSIESNTILWVKLSRRPLSGSDHTSKKLPAEIQEVVVNDFVVSSLGRETI